MTQCMGDDPTKPRQYGDLLIRARERLLALNAELHAYMEEDLAHDANSSEWRELYTLTRTISALADTTTIYQTHAYPPF